MATMESEKQKSNRRKRNQKRTAKAQMDRKNKQTDRTNIHTSNKKIKRTMDRKQPCGRNKQQRKAETKRMGTKAGCRHLERK